MPQKKRILFLTKYDQAGPSSRYRTYQYLPYLTDIDYTVSPLLAREYLHNRFTRGRFFKLWFIIKVYSKRIWCILNHAHQYDLLVIEYELLPYFPAWLERYLHWRNIRYIVDYDDALFHQYDLHKNSLVRKLLGNKIATVMRLSSHVVAGNAYLAEYAKQAGAKQVSIIPTVVDLANYRQAGQFKKADIFTIVWIGSPSTTPYLQEVLHALQSLNEQYTFRLRLIGAGEINLPGIDVERLEWQQDKEVEYISQCHVGIMPLPDTPWTRGKCGFKLIQYMACGLPVIASPVGMNNIILNKHNGFLATNLKNWTQAFEQVLIQPQMITKLGTEGRRVVEKKYCLEVNIKLFREVLKSNVH
jgi:glycosyltransferase involved in cell wall biosynthesis